MGIVAAEKLPRIALSIVALHLVVLVVNAATTCVWCDEINGYFLSCRPLGELLRLMADNVHEDPPLYDVLLHFWIPFSHYDPLLLRLLSVVFWALTLWGLFVSAKRLGGLPSGWTTLIVAALMPCHWLLPAALRWFSLFACLAVWNFAWFLSLWSRARHAPDPGGGWKDLLPAAIGYVATGAGMWYTNYSAPSLFFCHLLICLAWAERKLHLARWLVACFTAIGLLYLPWLPTFLTQLSTSTMNNTDSLLVPGGLSLYSLWAGEFSTPLAWWISIPAAATALTAAALALRHCRRVRLPLLIFVVVVLALWLSQTIWTIRMLIVSPFLALCLGVSLAAEWDRKARRLTALRWAFFTSAIILLTGSFVNMVKREGWNSYRWLDPVATTVRQIKSAQPGALMLTNSKVAFFYMQDELEPAGATGDFQVDARAYAPKVINYPIDEWFRDTADQAISRTQQIVFIHHAAYGGFFSRVCSGLTDDLTNRGFRAGATRSFLPMSPSFIRHSPKLDESESKKQDRSRVVVAYFARAGQSTR